MGKIFVLPPRLLPRLASILLRAPRTSGPSELLGSVSDGLPRVR